MWNKASRISEWAINLGSVGLLVFIAVMLVNPPRRNHVQLSHFVALRPGRTVQIHGVDWGKAPHTLVLALQTGCHFCADSAPFYRALLKERAPNWQAVAVLPQPVEQSVAYMRAKGYRPHAKMRSGGHWASGMWLRIDRRSCLPA